MAGEQCVKKFWEAVNNPKDVKKGTICKAGKRDKVINEKGKVVYRVWNTDIAVANRSKKRIVLNHGGWATNLTKDRMNKIIAPTGKRISQKQFAWSVDGRKWSGDKFTLRF